MPLKMIDMMIEEIDDLVKQDENNVHLAARRADALIIYLRVIADSSPNHPLCSMTIAEVFGKAAREARYAAGEPRWQRSDVVN